MNRRQSVIARIHIARSKALRCPRCGKLFFSRTGLCTECEDYGENLPDFYYRQILLSCGGEDSCSRLDDADLDKVMAFFDDAGFSKEFPHVSPRRDERNARLALQRRIYARAKEVLGPDWRTRLDGFVQKTVGRSALAYCSMEELRKVIGWINRAEKYAHKENQNG